MTAPAHSSRTLTLAGGASWPSGHASSSAALYGGLLLIALHSTRLAGNHRARRALQLLAGALIVLIGFSRVYLGVHYPTDVIAAWLLVAAWLTVLERTVGSAAVCGWCHRGIQ